MSERKKGSTSVSMEFRLCDSTTGLAKAAIDVTTLKLQFHRPREAPSVATSLTLLAAHTTAYTAFGAKEVDATNSKGIYRVDVPDGAFATGADEVTISISGTGIETSTREVDLVAIDTRNATTMGVGNLDMALSVIAAYIDTEVAAIKAKTDQLTFTTPNVVDASGGGGGTAPTVGEIADEVWTNYVLFQGTKASVPVSVSPKEALTRMAAQVCGTTSGVGTGTVVVAGLGIDNTVVTVTNDANFNRTGVTFGVGY